jgi:hypothetical protein
MRHRQLTPGSVMRLGVGLGLITPLLFGVPTSASESAPDCANQACELETEYRWCFTTDLDTYCDAQDDRCTKTQWCETVE